MLDHSIQNLDTAANKSGLSNDESQRFWSDFNVTLHHQFSSAKDSIDFFHWRNDQYFSYIDLMSVSGFDGMTVLDFGCGPGHDLVGFAVYSKAKRLVGVDISTTSVAEARARLSLHGDAGEVVLLDPAAARLPFEAGTFDHVHTSGVLQCLPNIDAGLLELHRVMKPYARLNVMVYNYQSIWMHLFVAYVKKIRENQYQDLSLRDAFGKTTDTEECPIANCYTPEEFIAIGERNGFAVRYKGSAISIHEANIAPLRFAAIQDRRLPEESRRFLLSLELDRFGYPIYQGHYAGIDACFELTKAV